MRRSVKGATLPDRAHPPGSPLPQRHCVLGRGASTHPTKGILLTPRDTLERSEAATAYDITFPQNAALGQDEEWCLVRQNGATRKVRFHDYGEIYELPGLYERLFYDHLKCTSPETVARLFRRVGILPDVR